MRALRLLWASPYSLVGLVLAPFFRRRRATRGVLLCAGASWPRRLGWRYKAITFGHVVLAVDDAPEDALLEHELVHVRQYERWGVAYGPMYLAASVGALLRGGHLYRDNAFETEARRVSGR
ncbi:MAG TPA: signal peptide prediction [Actinomycetota bacterium]|nr:signal peptide prediction [Actinomycetota bacterium]